MERSLVTGDLPKRLKYSLFQNNSKSKHPIGFSPSQLNDNTEEKTITKMLESRNEIIKCVYYLIGPGVRIPLGAECMRFSVFCVGVTLRLVHQLVLPDV
jgi:hypothetical protein